jgi:AmiR/NasT family two-component response regulator
MLAALRNLIGNVTRSLHPNCGELNLRYRLKDFSREQLVDLIVALDTAEHTDARWIVPFMAAEHDNDRLRALLASDYHTDKSLRHALHVADLETKCKRLRKEVRTMQEAAERHNKIAYATGLIVNCTGCDEGQPFNGLELTEERVAEVERIAARLRTWFENHQYRLKNKRT